VLTIEFPSIGCFESDLNVVPTEIDGVMRVLLETRRVGPMPTSCTDDDTTASFTVQLPRPVDPNEVVDATCWPGLGSDPPLTTAPRSDSTQASALFADTPECHRRQVGIGPFPPVTPPSTPGSTLPPLDD